MLQLSEQSLILKELKGKLLRINLHSSLLSKKLKESLPKKELTELQLKSKPPEAP